MPALLAGDQLMMTVARYVGESEEQSRHSGLVISTLSLNSRQPCLEII